MDTTNTNRPPEVEAVSQVARELQPFTITLTGEEAMELSCAILRNVIQNEELLRRFFDLMALARGPKDIELMMDMVAEKRPVPRYLKPLLIHITTKFDQVMGKTL